MSTPIEFKLKSCSVADFDSHKVMLEIVTMGRTHKLVSSPMRYDKNHKLDTAAIDEQFFG